MEVDRHPLEGCKGGTYRRDNIVPACAACNRLNAEEKEYARREREAIQATADGGVADEWPF